MRLYFSLRRLVYWRAPFAVRLASGRLLGLAGPRRPAADRVSVAKPRVLMETLLGQQSRFFAKPIVFDIVNKVKRNEVWTAHMGVD